MARPSPRTERLVAEARALALRTGRGLDTGHLLSALVGGDPAVADLVKECGAALGALAAHAARAAEGPAAVDDVLARADRVAEGCGAARVEPLHLLLALERVEPSRARAALEACGTDLARLRRVALARVTHGRTAPGPRPPTPAPGEAARPGAPARAAPPARPPAAGPPSAPASRAPDAEADADAVADVEADADAGPRAGTTAAGRADRDAGTPWYRLDPTAYPVLTELTRNLTELAAQGKLDPVIGRDKQVEEIADILGKRHANNPMLVGEPGVGKTALVEKLAQLAAAGTGFFAGKIIVELPVSSLLAGTSLRGSLSERLAALKDEVRRAGRALIVFIDETHQLVGAGAAGDGNLDVAGELRTALARGEFPCIGATTVDEYRKIIREHPALDRRFDMVLLPEPTQLETAAIVSGVIDRYERHHRVAYTQPALQAAVRLATRYVSERFLPEKVLTVLDLAGSRVRRAGRDKVTDADIASVISRMAEVPVDKLLQTDRERFLDMERWLGERIIGHAPVLTRLASVVRRNYAGFAGKRPIGSFLFLGPTGVGKTETVKCLADFLFQSREAMVRLDMSEYAEPHTVARLIGSPPGYVGHEEGGQLTEAVRRRPYQIVLLDEVEKAHVDVLLALLQILDDGRLTDGRGRTVDFSNCVVVMTSNLGSDFYRSRRGRIGFGTPASGSAAGSTAAATATATGAAEGAAAARDEMSDADVEEMAVKVLDHARTRLPIELWNRIDEKLVFGPLTRDQIRAVARLLVAESSARLAEERGISFRLTDDAVEHLLAHGGYDAALGARPMRQTLARLVEAPIAEQILKGSLEAGDEAVIAVEGGKLVVGRAPKPA
ncbi:MAG TPA: AAA family ATPase [Myxococcota bacterium]|nr:AAA family ATPase [Myxococcota bacterium]